MAAQFSMIQVPKPNVFIHNGRVLTTSRYVAELFEKRHERVLDRVRSLECSNNFTEHNFVLSEYTDSTGRKLPMYDITKDGFVFLAMGFTGKKAARFKEAYIAEFNRMEAELHRRPALPEPELDINYPLSWYTENYPLARMHCVDGTMVHINPNVIFDTPSPTMRILCELKRNGYEVEAAVAEVKALKHMMSEMRWALREIARMAETKSHAGLSFRL
ncbi:TPA: Rha family transcriptional regulator [Escherichia coli]|nr:Rha family transcriptional regulator [Escherichia coli]HEL8385900.1 Rha family transcriptional regulator [Escherichia coli]HEM0058742.1 Rha family transcriptional regulator [Escherichia coli]HEM0087203.1 Rha family transcriptional regulator [Escherichia coli]